MSLGISGSFSSQTRTSSQNSILLYLSVPPYHIRCLAAPQLLLRQLVEAAEPQQRRKNYEIFKDTNLWLPAVSSSRSHNPTQEVGKVNNA